MLYAEVIIPRPLDTTFTYRVPDGLAADIRNGSRVIVPFGPRRYYTGVVDSLSPVGPVNTDYAMKDVAMVVDPRPIVRHPQVKFWRWLAGYYLCSLGEVYAAALPAGLKIESETQIELNREAVDDDAFDLDRRESTLIELLASKGGVMSPREISSVDGFSNPEPVIARLLGKQLVVIKEKLVERFKARKESYVALVVNDGESPDDLFARVKGAKAQERALMALISLGGMKPDGSQAREVTRKALEERAAVTGPIIKELQKKGLVRLYDKEISRFTYNGPTVRSLPQLSDAQKRAYEEIDKAFIDHQVTLLHGVTSSGKTEIYITLIDRILRRGDRALFLVPEIALTTQLTRRLQRVFGDKVVIYHSKFSDAERVEVWLRLLNSDDPCVVIGARSAVFLPFGNLGLVIVDEEHDPSYKQADPAPRYNGRDAAIVLATMHGAKVLLGSATPSVETYYKAVSGKYGLVTLTERFSGATLPEVEIVDLNRERQAGRMTGAFADRTLAEARKNLNEGRQVIFFLNRRGYSPVARCKMCGFVPKCDFCDVSLTYHRRPEELVCHYCGTVYPMMKVCPSCHEPTLEVVGYGTERVEDEITASFSDRRIIRMDLDTTRNKNAYADLVADFSAHKADILVGTQMVTKGLDFGDVGLVIVSGADRLAAYPDFHSTERAFNLISQVSGRAGRRRDTQGRVLIETRNPDNPVFALAAAHDYLSFYKTEVDERRAFNYPPFTRIIDIYIKHKDSAEATRLANIYAARLRELFGNRVSGPQEPMVARVKLMYIRKIMLKIEVEASMTKVKEILRNLYIETASSPLTRGLRLYYDVDPA